MTKRTAIIGVGFAAVLLLACKGKQEEAPPEAVPAAHGTTAPATAGGAHATHTTPTTHTAPSVNDKGIPAIPDGRSDPPSSAEWSSAPTVNTQEANSQAKDCSMKVVREWLKVHCEGDIKSISDKEGLPKSSADYFESIQLGKYADFVFRLRKGGMKMRIHRDGNRASLFINWPPSTDRPLNIALAQIKE